MQIDGRVALISGGASGLGAATAKRLAGLGAKISIVDLNEEAGQAMASELGNNSIFSTCNVTNEDQVIAAVNKTIESLGQIDIVVNCAGIGVGQRTVGRDGPHDLGAFQRVMSVNVFGTFSVLSQAGARMVENEPDESGCRGVIVNTASVAAFDGQIGQVAYSASKGAVVGMTLPIARDLASMGIRCCTICPGTFDTPMMQGLRDDIKQALAASIPNPSRLGRPEEYAMLVEQIVSNPYLNGETIRLDGALRMAPR